MKILSDLQKELCKKVSKILHEKNSSDFCVPDFPIFIFMDSKDFKQNDKIDSMDFSTLPKKIQSVSINKFGDLKKNQASVGISLIAGVSIKTDENIFLQTSGTISLARVFTESPESIFEIQAFLNSFDISPINLPVFKVAQIETESDYDGLEEDKAFLQKKWRILQEKWQKPKKSF